MSGLVEMSLDEIIATKKRGKGGAGGKFAGRGRAPGRQQRGRDVEGGEGRAQFTKRVPEGKWKHDKFHEIYSGGPRAGGRSAPVDNRVVKVNMSNLAKSVVTADLEELFGSYKPTNVSVHYDESGRSLGTADVFLHRRDATKLINDFRGISLDEHVQTCHAKLVQNTPSESRWGGRADHVESVATSRARRSSSSFTVFRFFVRTQSARRRWDMVNLVRLGRELKMVLVDESTATATTLQQRIGVSGARRIQRNGPRTSGAITKKRSSPVRKAGNAKRDKKPNMTAEELDAELEAYMRKSKPADVVM
uniref:FoP_duplication domain-containing protein n=1 Tax=Steinernema glaseri TaxID=37863 RepID=A0A1I8A793_9BILA